MVANVRKPVIDRRPRQSADPGHQADPAASQHSCFHRDKTPEALFIQNRRHLPITLACIACLRGPNHSATLRRSIPPCESAEQTLASAVLWLRPTPNSLATAVLPCPTGLQPFLSARLPCNDGPKSQVGSRQCQRSRFRRS